MSIIGNQGTLEKDVDLYFQDELLEKNALKGTKTKIQTAETVEKSHGRIEIRKCWVSTDTAWLDQKEKWKDLRSLIRLESERIIDGKSSIEIRYYISSLNVTPDEILEAIRAHRGVESMHWVLDVAFSEDARSKINDGND